MLDSVKVKRKRDGKNQESPALEQPACIAERLNHRRRNVLEDIAGNDEVVFCRPARIDFGNVQPRLAVEECVEISEAASQIMTRLPESSATSKSRNAIARITLPIAIDSCGIHSGVASLPVETSWNEYDCHDNRTL